jgi:hypothetical protein
LPFGSGILKLRSCRRLSLTNLDARLFICDQLAFETVEGRESFKVFDFCPETCSEVGLFPTFCDF